jgi:pimeloyl-ACP methyl ester carboxylesterase
MCVLTTECAGGLAPTDHRVVAPYLRGYGSTQYRSADIIRSGEQAAIAKDVVDLLDSLKIERAIVVGYDWGGRAACAAAALWPERVKALVAIGGYTIQNIAKSAGTPEPVEQVHREWYQWYFQTEQGRKGLDQDREAFCKLCWQLWSPTWRLDEALFATTAKSFKNSGFVETVIHSYRHRFGKCSRRSCPHAARKAAVPTAKDYGAAATACGRIEGQDLP